MNETSEQMDESNEVDGKPFGVKVREGWSRLRERRWVRWTMDIVFFVGLFFAISAWQQRGMIGSGETVPDFQLERLDGGVESLIDPQADKTLVYFWAPWCGVCGAESGTVGTARSWLGESVSVRSVALDYRDRASVESKVREDGIDYPVYLGDARVRDAFKIQAFPTIYVVSKDGEIQSSSMGYTTTIGLLWRAWF